MARSRSASVHPSYCTKNPKTLALLLFAFVLGSFGFWDRQILVREHDEEISNLKAELPRLNDQVLELKAYLGDAGESILEKLDPSSNKNAVHDDPIDVERREKVKEATLHAWNSYVKYAWGQDELQPQTRNGVNSFGGLGATLVDSLDTLYIMGLYEQFQKAREWVANSLDFNKNYEASVFETTIRVLGGLLSAYDLSGDNLFLEKAQHIAERLLPAWNTPSGIPYNIINLANGNAHNSGWTAGKSILADSGTEQLEFIALSQRTGDPKYRQKVERVITQLRKVYPSDGLLPIFIDPHSGMLSDHSTITFGAMGDREMWETSMQGLLSLVRKSTPSSFSYICEKSGDYLNDKMDELACFVPGMLALGSSGYGPEDAQKFLSLAEELAWTCYNFYQSTPTGLAGENYFFRPKEDMIVGTSWNILRPETIESLMYLWRVTGNKTYQEWGWNIFQAFERNSRVDSGFVGLRDVNTGDKDNMMQSFFLAETLKYLYLLFSPPSVFSLDEWLLCMADDRLVLGEPLFQNQTITSEGGNFELGFFSPGNSSSTNRYVGIWYKNNITQKTIVWVANREKPLADSAGVLRIVEDGNIALLDGGGSILWSSNITSNQRNTTSAVLLNSGNLVLRDGESNTVWQSFDHPTDTLLPTMEIALDLGTGSGWNLVSWKDAQDPSPGRFSLGVDPRSPLQLAIWNGSRILWRSFPWDGRQIAGQIDSNSSSLVIQSITIRGRKISMTYTTTRLLVMSMFLIDSNGQGRFLYWDNQVMNWTLLASTPSRPCDFYDRCGPFGVCYSEGSPLCRCLEGFQPKDKGAWDRGDFTGGCVRTQPLSCDRTADRFLVSGQVKLPDRFLIHWNATAAECEARCRADCQCSAYAHADIRAEVVTGSRCLTWVGKLIDVGRYVNRGEDLYVRHAASGLEASVTSEKKNVTRIIIPSSIAGVLLGGIFCFFLWRRQKRQVRMRKASRGLLNDEKRFSEMLAREKDVSEVPLLEFSTVEAATNNFASANMLGRGGFGPVYKGTLFKGHEIAVKRLSKSSGQGFEEFENEVKLIAKLQHTNLVRLLGWCCHKEEKILVYEYLPNGSLDKFIFDQRRSAELDWEKRFKIIEGIAHGLLYLHRYSRLRIIHRDLKASNILLDASMNPKISDFVLLLEIITGKRSTGFYPYKESMNLLGSVWHMWEEGRGSEVLDPSADGILGAPDVMKCMQVGLLCVQDDAAERPTMSSVVFMLGKESASLPVPKLPAFATKSPNSVSDMGLLTTSKELTASETD
ncbi:hypothetical protein Taro_036506 [Colocasia esculenta]|uniref:alpha-1,2-Mannosidase n=1 Tax=Colocasia esculenta TaxID=4460 RepID=A0A843WA01_COLES|nr:hypothetical protein [Colocasia esculenta]